MTERLAQDRHVLTAVGYDSQEYFPSKSWTRILRMTRLGRDSGALDDIVSSDAGDTDQEASVMFGGE